MVFPTSTDEFDRINRERLERERREREEAARVARAEQEAIERERAGSASTTPGEAPRAEIRRIAERERAQREAFIERESRLTDEQRREREELSDRAFRERLRGGQTDISAGIRAISREEFERISRSKFTASEKRRTERFLKEREKRIQREYLESIRDRLRQIDINIQRAELDRLNDQLETLNNRNRGIAREGLKIAGDLGLSMIPVYGTVRDARRTARNWDQLSTQERALDVGLLSLSAIGDATFIFGVGAGIKTAVAGARGTQRVVSTTATLSRSDDVINFVRLADRARNPVNAIEVAAAPDAKFISQVGKVAEKFPTKTFDILVEPTQKSIRSAKRIQNVIEEAAPPAKAGRFTTPSNTRFVVELDKSLPKKKIDEIVDGLGKGAPGKPRNVTVRLIDRGLTNAAADDVAEAIADARRAFSSGKNIDSLASQRITNDTSDALKDAIIRARRLQAQRKTQSEAQIKASLTKDAKKEIDDLASDPKKLNSSGKTLADRLRRNDFNVKVEELKFKPVDNVRGVERNVRFEPEPPKPIRQGGSAGRGSGDNRAVALLERTSRKTEAQTAPRISGRAGTRRTAQPQREARAVGAPVPAQDGDGEGKRQPSAVPTSQPGRAGSPAPDDAPGPTPNILDLPSPGPDPGPQPQPDPDPDNVPDPTKSDTDTPPIKRGEEKKGRRAVTVKLAPQLVDSDGNKLFPVVFNYRLGKVYKTANLITGKQTTSRRIPKGGVEGGITPQETLKAVGFSERTPSKKRFELTDTVDAVVSADKRITFKGKRRKLDV